MFMQKCVECRGLTIVVFAEVAINSRTHRATGELNAYTCAECGGSGKRSLLQNLLTRWRVRRDDEEELAEGGTCLITIDDLPPLAYGGLLNTINPDVLERMKAGARDQRFRKLL